METRYKTFNKSCVDEPSHNLWNFLEKTSEEMPAMVNKTIEEEDQFFS